MCVRVCVCVCVQLFFHSGPPAAVMAECVCLLSSSLSRGTTLPHLRSKWILTRAPVKSLPSHSFFCFLLSVRLCLILMPLFTHGARNTVGFFNLRPPCPHVPKQYFFPPSSLISFQEYLLPNGSIVNAATGCSSYSRWVRGRRLEVEVWGDGIKGSVFEFFHPETRFQKSVFTGSMLAIGQNDAKRACLHIKAFPYGWPLSTGGEFSIHINFLY